jgi:hypothetical protein
LEQISRLLRQHGFVLKQGLSDAEIGKVESTFSFRFPPDLRQLLQYVLPVSAGFPNWRDEPEGSLKDRLAWPADGICFDIINNSFWLEGWGPRPPDAPTALGVARQELAKVPVLIPIYSHRYIPEEPHLAGNPIFSVYQTDIIYYGKDLTNYFANEFSLHGEHKLPAYGDVRKISFWSQLVEA